jgi:hypothetical protein
LSLLLRRVARFFFVKYTRIEKIYQITAKMPNDRKIYQIAEKWAKWP